MTKLPKKTSHQNAHLIGKSTNLDILSLNRMFLKENLFRWMMRISGRRHTDSCLVACRWALHSGQYLHEKKENVDSVIRANPH